MASLEQQDKALFELNYMPVRKGWTCLRLPKVCNQRFVFYWPEMPSILTEPLDFSVNSSLQERGLHVDVF